MEKRLLVSWFLAFLSCAHCRTVDKSSEDLMGVSSSQQNSKRGSISYHWKTGNWGLCFSDNGANGCGQGIKERPVWCVDSEQRTALEFLCEANSQPERTRPCFIACRHHKDKLKWEVGPWGPCMEAENKKDLTFNTGQNGDNKENYGLMQRNVSCILTSHDDVKLRMVVDEENCFTVARKPDPVRLCNIPKPQNCVVTEFFGWSQCRACLPHANQTRIRNVIVAPKNGGKPCPDLSETRSCRARKVDCSKSSNEIRNEYRLKVGAWKKCEAPDSLISADEIEYRLSRQNHLHPDRHSILPLLDSSSSAESSEKQTIFQPQVGYQTREIVCKDSKGALVDISFCNKKSDATPSRLRSCVVSQDCIVSEWSAWVKIQEGCTETSGLVRSEVHERKRQVVRLPEGNGQPCPHLVEKKETSNKESLPLCKHKYKRMPSKWSDCVVTQGSELVKVGCGGGIQLRTISCVMTSSRQPVEDSHCSVLEDPQQLPTVQRCEVACPRDCTVGEWGPWGPCVRGPCDKNSTTPVRGYRERKRNILVEPSEKGLSCPSTSEVQPCNEVHCFHWSAEHWGICVLDTPGKCGLGTRKRIVRCLDSSGASADASFCSYETQPPEQEPCLLPCPFDCVLSPWSDWSPCSHPCSGPKMIALRQRNRTIIAPPGPGGHKCPNPDELLQMEPCNTHSCHGYSWLALPWQPCKSEEDNSFSYYYKNKKTEYINPIEMLMKNVSLNNVEDFEEEEEPEAQKDCGKGMRTREVWCVENNGIRVMDSKCHPLDKPITSESCTKECPINCQLSPWSEWSACPQECVPDASNEVKDGETAPIQSRSRVILKSPTSGGLTCQHLEELRPCPLSAARCKHYQWQLTNWSDCQLPANLKCGQGFRTRGVWCSRNHRTTKVSPTFCMENVGPAPSLSEKCTVDCKHQCVLTEWSRWSPCKASCRGVSTRTRQLIEPSATKPQCLNSDAYPLVQTEACPCELFTAMPDGEWSTCIIESPVEKVTANGRMAHGMCGSGVRYKKNICMNSSGQMVEPSFCELESSLIEEACIVPCPVDCVQSSWSTWGECSSLCGPGFQNRTREIIQEPRENGRPCGPSVEVKICNTPCSNFKWISSGYTQCSLIRHDENHGCGTGDQYRTIRCMDYSQGGVAIQVKDEYCDPMNQPDDISACHISCPGDCVVSPWSSWSDCDKPCSSNKQRQRTRLLLRSPSLIDATSTDCPHLIQVQNCQINVTCFTYDWKSTAYGSCLPLGGSPCGEGVQTRAIFCERSDGRAVDDSFCDSENKPTPTEKWCYLGCPVDCELSSWSFWNSSECVCGSSNGFEHRYRKIVTSPSDTGRPCPVSLEQSRPCPVVPCYTWFRGPWSSCKLEGASCGHGTVYRNISCYRGSVKVDTSFCLAQNDQVPETNLNDIELVKLDLNTEASCYLPCHGDCEVSEWSKWSHCHRNCQDNPTGGYQTRSRAVLKKSSPGGEPCPTSLWETRPCHSSQCLTFHWTIVNDEIICKRSDGLVTLGGCDENKKPCLKNCSVIKSSRCSAGSCSCLEGYQPLHDPDKKLHLIECVATTENNSNRQKLSHPATMTDDDDMMKSRLLYLPTDEFNIWMFAMIGIGCLFVVFVAVSIYLMCHNSNTINQENGTQMLNVAKP